MDTFAQFRINRQLKFMKIQKVESKIRKILGKIVIQVGFMGRKMEGRVKSVQKMKKCSAAKKHLQYIKTTKHIQKMERQFLILQQNYQQLQQIQPYLQVWEQQQHLYKTIQKQNNYFQKTQLPYLHDTYQQTGQYGEQGRKEYNCDSPPNPPQTPIFLSLLSKKLLQNFTEYQEKLTNVIDNEQTQIQSKKRQRRQQDEDITNTILYMIQANQLFVGEQSKIFQEFVKIKDGLRAILIGMLGGCGRGKREEVMLVFFYIYKQISNTTTDTCLQSLTQTIHQQILHNIHKLPTLCSHLQHKNKPTINPKTRQKVQQYFQELIQNWVRYMYDMESNNYQKYQQELQEQQWMPITMQKKEEKKKSQTWDEEKGSVEQEGEWDDEGWGRKCRKIRPVFF